MSTSVNMLLLFDQITIPGPPPPGEEIWIDNQEQQMITNTGEIFVFNPGA